MRSKRLLQVVLLLMLLPSSAHGLDEDFYQNRTIGLSLEIPEGWTMFQQTGYPSILLLLIAKKGQATINLAQGELHRRQTLLQFIKENQKGYRALDLRIGGYQKATVADKRGWRQSLKTRDGDTAIQQFFVQHLRQVIIVTLAAPATQLAAYLPDFHQILAQTKLSQSAIPQGTIQEAPNSQPVPTDAAGEIEGISPGQRLESIPIGPLEDQGPEDRPNPGPPPQDIPELGPELEGDQ